MTALAYLKDPAHGCATVSELVALGKAHPGDLQTLKAWAVEEGKNKGIDVILEPAK